MKVRRLLFGKDYPEICEWWRARQWPEVRQESLPANGLIAEKDGIKYAAVWVYIDGGLGIMDWMVTNPKAPLRGRKASIQALVNFIKLEAAPAGARRVVTFTANKNLKKIYQECGFRIGDESLTSFVMEVGK